MRTRWLAWPRRLIPRTLRGRITVVYALGSGLILVAVLVLGYLMIDLQAHAAVSGGLRARTDDLLAAVRDGDLDSVRHDPYAQLVDANGVVLDHSASAGVHPLVTGPVLEQAGRRPVERSATLPNLPDDSLLRAVPVGDGRVVVTATSLDIANRSLDSLGTTLLIAAPVLLLATTFGIRQLVGAALRPVEALSARAEEISVAEPGQLLTTPGGDDEIAHLARRLNAMLERLAVTRTRELSFVDDASHELRTPVSVISAEVELALSSDRPGDWHDALVNVGREASRLSTLTSDLLALARAESVAGLSADPVNLADLARDSASRAVRGRPVRVELATSYTPAVVDSALFDRAVDNIVRNAVSVGAHRIQISAAGEPDGSVTLSIADDGPGFPPEFLPAAFERFARAGRARARDNGEGGVDGGTGLGLAIVAAVVRAHDGRVEAANGGPLGGAVLTIRLPPR